MGMFHFCWKLFQHSSFFSLFLTVFFLLMGGSFLYLENKCYWFVNINALPFLIRKEEFYGSKILHSCSFCKLKWIFNKTFLYYSKFLFYFRILLKNHLSSTHNMNFFCLSTLKAQKHFSSNEFLLISFQ